MFAPAAGLIAAGEVELGDLGEDVDPDTVVPLLLPLPEVEPGRISGEAWWVDAYGNVETNIGPEEMELAGFGRGATVTVRVGSSTYEVVWATTFGDVEEGEAVLHVDSAGLMALAVRGDRADEAFNLGVGTALSLGG